MIISTLKILISHGYQAIPDLDKVELTGTFRGIPTLTTKGVTPAEVAAVAAICPTKALSVKPFSLDMGRCLFCGECARLLPSNIMFSNNWRGWSFTREGLVVHADRPHTEAVCNEPYTLFSNSFKLRQVSAGGDAANEMELNAAGNVNFDMRRFGVEFVASPRHADAVVVTGPVTKSMSQALEITLAAIPQPRLVIAVGTEAISGGLFEESEAVDRSFFHRHTPHLYVPGNPAHPLTFIGGVMSLIGRPLSGQKSESEAKQKEQE